MDSKSLMIGDWVYIEEGDKLGKTQVVCITEDNTDWLHPIPLTPEILEKNGFEKVNTQRYDWGDPNSWYVNINPKKKIIHINGANGSNCNMYYSIVGFYVHELQRALRLCGLTELANGLKI